MPRKYFLPLAVVIVVVLAAGGYVVLHGRSNKTANNAATSSPMSDGMTASPAANSTQASATDKVTIQNFAFGPAAITVKVGTTVTWTNQDTATHTVTESDKQAGPDSSNLKTGASYSFTFTKAGTYHYYCAIHPSMTASVTVTE